MNQRAGKTHRAALGDNMADMNLRNFFRTAARVLDNAGDDEASFYFNQVVEHLNEGKPLPQSVSETARVLGL